MARMARYLVRYQIAGVRGTDVIYVAAENADEAFDKARARLACLYLSSTIVGTPVQVPAE